MKITRILYWEWIQLVRAPYKIIALILFGLAGIAGIINGVSLYQKQLKTLEQVESTSREQQESVKGWFADGKTGPEDRPWIDVSTPFWAMWYSAHQANKVPSPMMAFAIGQAEQYGFYKRVNVWSTAYDNDMAEEISNPERVVLGALDFSFVSVFLLPLLLIILTFNIGGYEQDKQLAGLIQLQQGIYTPWIIGRVSGIGVLVSLFLTAFILLSGIFSGAFMNSPILLLKYLASILCYQWIWLILIGCFIYLKLGQTAQAMAITLVWVMVAIVIPGMVHQASSLSYPNNLMVKYLDAKRVDQEKIYAMPHHQIWSEVSSKLPELKSTKLASLADSLIPLEVKGGLFRTEIAFHMMDVHDAIEAGFEKKNKMIQNSYWFNPLVGIQNYLFELAGTDYYSYAHYRRKIQNSNLDICKMLILDEWNGVRVTADVYAEYLKLLNKE